MNIYFQDINVQLIEDVPKYDLQGILGKYIWQIVQERCNKWRLYRLIYNWWYILNINGAYDRKYKPYIIHNQLNAVSGLSAANQPKIFP